MKFVNQLLQCLFGPWVFYSVFRCVRRIAKSDLELCYICSSVCMELLSFHWTDFLEILYL